MTAVASMTAEDHREGPVVTGSFECREERLFAELAALLEWVETVPTEAAGTLDLRDSVTARPLGTVRVEGGRVCWASVIDSTPTLTGRIAARTRLDRERLAALYEECQTSGQPLGEALVERGLLAADEFRGLLLRHVSTAVGRLVRLAVDQGARWGGFEPQVSSSYYPAFTFKPTDLVPHLLQEDIEFGLSAAPLADAFEQLCDSAAKTACFLLGSAGRPLILLRTSKALEDRTLAELEVLARDGHALLERDSWEAAGERLRMICLSEDTGAVLVVCRLGRHLLVSEMDDHVLFVSSLASLRRALVGSRGDAG